MRSIKIQSFAFALLVVGASAAVAVACPNNDKSATAASYTSAGKSECSAHASNTAAVAASSGHMSCGMSKSAVAEKGECSMHGASATACTFGKNTVTLSGDACPAAHEADYAFAVKGADCQGTSEQAVKAIKSVRGVSAVTVDYSHHMAYICADCRTADKSAIAGSLKKAGFGDVKFVSQDKANCAKSHGKVAA